MRTGYLWFVCDEKSRNHGQSILVGPSFSSWRVPVQENHMGPTILYSLHAHLHSSWQELFARWIDGRPGEKRAPGAYCTGFRKSRTPRVYLSTYSGSFQSVSTLAHGEDDSDDVISAPTQAIFRVCWDVLLTQTWTRHCILGSFDHVLVLNHRRISPIIGFLSCKQCSSVNAPFGCTVWAFNAVALCTAQYSTL